MLKFLKQAIITNINPDYLNEWIFSGGSSDTGQPGPLTRQKYQAQPFSRIAAYGPRIVYQGNSGEIRELNNNCSSKTQCYYDKTLSTTQARNGTQLLVLPAKSDLTSMAVFYQEQDGRFLEYREDSTGVTTVLQNRKLHSGKLDRSRKLTMCCQQRRFQT